MNSSVTKKAKGDASKTPLNSSRTIKANTSMEDARNTFRDWLKDLNLERYFDEVLFKWQLLKKNPKPVTFSFQEGDPKDDKTDGNNCITVYHSNVEHPQTKSVEPSTFGNSIEQALKISIDQTGVYHGQGYIEDILDRALKAWMTLTVDPPTDEATFDYDAADGEIRVTAANCNISPIRINKPGN